MTPPAASDIRVGAILRDTYELTSLLGKGGMGTVFLARHRRLPGRQVAVKVLQNSASLNPELYARFRREAEIASQLGHPNIVEVLDFDTSQDGTPFLVMEYLRGESLEQRLSRGPLPVDEALSIIRQICSALQAAHRAGVVHRDLKPANVFLVPTDSGGVVGERVKLLDFGISKMLDSQTLQTQDAVLIGTPQYMAPEQALGKNSEVDARTDIFALGCIVYEMLSGRPPFAGDGGSIVQVVFRIVHAQPEPLASLCPDVPARVLSTVERALAKSPPDRYLDVASFIAELTGSPLQSLSGAVVPSFSSSRAASVPFSEAEEGGFAATHVPSSTARFPAPAAATDEAGFAATLVPASTALSPAQVTAQRAVPARSGPGMGLLAGAGVLVLGLVAVGWWFGSRSTPVPGSGAPVPVAVTAPAPKPSPAPEPPAEMKAPSEPEPTAEPEPIAAPEPPAAATSAPVAPVATGSKPPARQAGSEALPEEVRSALQDAERALIAGEAEDAIRLARGSQRTQVTSASFSVLARAYCRQKDLSNARAQWRRLSTADRGAVRRYCKQYDIEF
ncbi:serine/threonine-protein kinase [Archangium sp.]|uniref:serine/threonine-protein kinase n=1 Tax=Archangium sp. TaxID=1872627 RepID=UPI002D4F9DB1|nr:serine/threonine-protein kinase [Archangium sp.]HYO59210.1 serine/threonine-protein kinase [Archangium sp.]